MALLRIKFRDPLRRVMRSQSRSGPPAQRKMIQEAMAHDATMAALAAKVERHANETNPSAAYALGLLDPEQPRQRGAFLKFLFENWGAIFQMIKDLMSLVPKDKKTRRHT